jgi:peptidoglycan hydrolase-like protein with peptidoglycan-binding domain
MKRYSFILRSGATMSLSILYVATSLFPYTFVRAEEAFQEVQAIEESSNIVDTQDFSLEESGVIFSEQVDPHEKTIPEQTEGTQSENSEGEVQEVVLIEEQTEVEKKSVELEGAVCDQVNSPVLSFESKYADSQPGGAETILLILSQIGASATDPQDGSLTPTNNLLDFYPFESGWHEVTFTATDTEGCVISDTVDIFIFGNQYSPVCSSGEVYIRANFPEEYTTLLGTSSLIYSEQWFPVMYNEGTTLDEDASDILADHDISVIRAGSSVLINLDEDIPEVISLTEAILGSIEISGGTITSTNIFSGSSILVQFESTECESEVCSATNNPYVSGITQEVVTISENSTYSEDEILALFGVAVEDQDGEGLISVTSNLSSLSYQNEGTYFITMTFTDNEGCIAHQRVTLNVEGEDTTNEEEEDNGGGNGVNGSKKEPQGEVLGVQACEPYITTFIQMGQVNLEADVKRLQTFLNEYMGEEIVVDGIYGQTTFEAVKRFQAQEFDEILAPWGITEPTGIARETTVRHINNIMCPELNIAMPILYCATTGNLIYPDGTIVDPDPEYILYNGRPIIKTWVVAPQSVLGEIDYQYEK